MNENIPNRIPLSALATGRTATVVAVAGSGALRRRLLEMGLTPGAAVMLRKRAPLGDPLELSLRGYELSLRTADAQYIEVEVGRTC